jgi:hypothetical protein
MSASDSDDSKRAGYFRQLHLELLAVLLIVFVVLVIVGWHLRPQSGGFPPVDDGLQLNYLGPMLGDGVSESITLTPGGGSILVLSGEYATAASGIFNPHPWQMQISDLAGGRFCGTDVGERTHVTAFRPNGSTTGIDVHGKAPPAGFVYLKLCWATAGVANLDGAYLSATFPALDSNDEAGVIGYSPTYLLSGASLLGTSKDWTFQTQAPASRTADWSWPADAGPFSIAAVNTNTSQHDDYLTFVSGVILGVAAGTLISILTELVAPFSRRRDDRKDDSFRRTP